jgi:hypothetical protein
MPAPAIAVAPPTTYINRKTFLVAVVLALLLTVGLMTLVAVQSLRKPPEPCKPFTIGQSALGSCDWVPGRLTTPPPPAG